MKIQFVLGEPWICVPRIWVNLHTRRLTNVKLICLALNHETVERVTAYLFQQQTFSEY